MVFSASLHVRAAGAEERDDGRADGYDDVAKQLFDFVVHCSDAVFGVVGFGLITLVGLPCGLRVRRLKAGLALPRPECRVALRSPRPETWGGVACLPAGGPCDLGGVRCSPTGFFLLPNWKNSAAQLGRKFPLAGPLSCPRRITVQRYENASGPFGT